VKSNSAESRKSGAKRVPASREFILRALSGIVLATLALLLTWGGIWPFAFLVFICTALLAWEWAGMRGLPHLGMPVIAHAAASGIALFFTALGEGLFGVIAISAGAILVGLLSFRENGGRPAGLSILGVFYFGLPALAMVFLRGGAEYGLIVILFLFMVVWGEDIAAYIFGRLIGGPKLASAISPGKTWSGFTAGIIFPAIAAFSFSLWLGTGVPIQLAIVAAFLAFAAQLGDLCESAAKRTYGVKDSSTLIPGHGGVFDRLDGLLFAALCAGVIALIRDPDHPGRALLIWP